MYKKTLKVLAVIVIMWIVSLFTIERNSNLIVFDSSTLYEQALNKLRRQYHRAGNASKSLFRAWNMLEMYNPNLTVEEKLGAIKGYEFPPGMGGRAVLLADGLKGTLRMLVRRGWSEHAFNKFVSDMIPVTRTLPDPRDEWCKKQKIMKMLPQASVIICFYNEAWSTLIRTIHSVLMRSPDHLLKEIILFDDYSSMHHLKERLENYVRTLPKVKLVRSVRREGLIRGRILATKYAIAPVVVFLDSHCECAPGWLEPLLYRIAKDSRNVVSPVVDYIHDDTFEYIPQDTDDLRIGGFTWQLKFTWKTIPREYLTNRKDPAAPIKTPTISGGLFAINKKFFEYLGYYDQGFEVWGAENLELSFKTWMCGGTLEIIPCSHVGHVFRKRFPYFIQRDSIKRNSVRLAEVWLDDYAKYFYERIGNEKGDFGNITDRIQLRKKLNCKSFDWYLKNVYVDMEIPDHYVASGRIYSTSNYALCMDASTASDKLQESIQLLPCHSQGGNQFWVYTKDGEIKRDDVCLDYILEKLVLFLCRGRAASQVWLYNEQSQTIRHMRTQKCLRYIKHDDGYQVALENCSNTHTQKWVIENFKAERLAPELRVYATRRL